MKCPITGKNCLKHKGFEADGKLVCEDCFHKKSEGIQSANDTTCASCGMSLADIVKGSRLGCAACYDNFPETMPHIVGSVQRADSGVRHVGRTPRSFIAEKARSVSEQAVREEISMRMNSAAANCDYKEAARMKSKMKELDSLKEEGRADLAERLALLVMELWTGSQALN